MRWIICLVALLTLSACDDDSTGPGTQPVVEWVEVESPTELGLGTVVKLATGAARVVALVHSETGEWVIEETPTGWATVLGKPLPHLRSEFASPRAIRLDRASEDLVVSDKGGIYVVGLANPSAGPYGGGAYTPAIWAEADTGWVLTPGPDGAGALLAAEWDAGAGIEAVGIAGTTLLTARGTPETGMSWSSPASPYTGTDTWISQMALVDGSVYAAGSFVPTEIMPGGAPFGGLFLQGSEGDLELLESPCGTCPNLAVASVEPRNGGVYWGGLVREDVPLGTPAEAVGWLATYDTSSKVWIDIELPPQIERVADILNLDGTLFLAVRTEAGSGIYRSQGRRFVAEFLPEGGHVYSLAQTPDGRVIGAGSWAQFPERGDLLLVERK